MAEAKVGLFRYSAVSYFAPVKYSIGRF